MGNPGFATEGSLFSKAYHPLTQQYFSAGPLPFWGGGVHFHVYFLGVHFCFHFGGHFHVHFWGGGGVHFHAHFWGVHFNVHFWGGPLMCSLLGGSHVIYPIMLLYTTIEYPSASRAKFTWDPPRVGETDRQTRLKTLPSHTLHMRAVIMTHKMYHPFS